LIIHPSGVIPARFSSPRRRAGSPTGKSLRLLGKVKSLDRDPSVCQPVKTRREPDQENFDSCHDFFLRLSTKGDDGRNYVK
jgi:hypothetical protein